MAENDNRRLNVALWLVGGLASVIIALIGALYDHNRSAIAENTQELGELWVAHQQCIERVVRLEQRVENQQEQLHQLLGWGGPPAPRR